ncbi:hypothetical protein HGRIS_010687 [Hohenbuehelia grisea]|uniref:Uncharacterized protein n=1 Tax=Hohenbuehelia grisea TaxID=104357 RepID=A0ABR3IXP1_9AGAR
MSRSCRARVNLSDIHDPSFLQSSSVLSFFKFACLPESPYWFDLPWTCLDPSGFNKNVVDELEYRFTPSIQSLYSCGTCSCILSLFSPLLSVVSWLLFRPTKFSVHGPFDIESCYPHSHGDLI